MAFNNIELDNVCPAYGWQGGPEFNTRITALKNGREVRNATWDRVRHRYSLPFNMIPSDDYLDYVKSAFLAMRGQLHSFLIMDWSDNVAENAQFGIGDGTTKTFQLSIPATFGMAIYTRVITKPLAGATFTVNGTTTAGTLDTTTGLVKFATAPAIGAVLRWSGGFRIQVRFSSDALLMSIDSRRGQSFAMSGSIDLIETYSD